MEFNYQKQPGRERKRFYAPDPKDALVSVITPYYNAGKYFEQTFNSVMNQTFPWFEWIIVNDGSPREEDAELLYRLAATDRRITVITQANAGPCVARNNAIAHTHTDLIVPLDADDLIDPTYIECLYWSMKYNPDAAWSYSNSCGFQEQEYIWKYPFSAKTMKTYNFLNYTGMIRKKDILDIGGYKDEKKPYHEDWRFWLDMLSMSKKPVRVASILFWYRRLGSGRLSSVNGDPQLAAECDRIIEQAARTVDETVQVLEYPVKKTNYPFFATKNIQWNRHSRETNDRKKVLWLIPWMVMGGADKFNLDAIAGLTSHGIDNFVITTNVSENEWQQKFKEHTDEIFCLPDFLDPAHYLEFVSYYIQSRQIDTIMLTNSYDGYYMVPWIRQHFPDVVIVDYIHMEEWYWREGGYARTSGVLTEIVEKTYVCNSRTKHIMSDHFGRKEESVDCLYIGVDHNYFCKEKEQPGYLHDLLKLPSERDVILFPCRVHPQKRPFMMLEIAERTRKVMPDVAFVVAGDGDQLDELKNTIRECKLENTVFCIGATSKMRACYRDSALTLICSLKEGLALTAYESLSMGVPVVSSDVGGQRDLIGSDVGALIPLLQDEKDIDNRNFAENEITPYVEEICRILQDKELHKQLSSNGRKKIEEGFSIEKMVETLVRELDYLHNDAEMAAQRHAVASALGVMEKLAGDYYTIYLQWKNQSELCEEMWRERCWFEQLWKESNTGVKTAPLNKIKQLVHKILPKLKRKLKGWLNKWRKIRT